MTIGQAALANSSVAAQGDIPFVADVTNNNACVIIVQREGTLVQNPAGTQLNSKLAGGQSGVADVYSIWRYEVSVSGPFVFSSRPAGGDDGVTFTTLFSGQSIFRGRTFAEQPGNNAVRLRSGFSITRINVNLIADRPDPFPAGTYQADATVRCE